MGSGGGSVFGGSVIGGTVVSGGQGALEPVATEHEQDELASMNPEPESELPVPAVLPEPEDDEESDADVVSDVLSSGGHGWSL